jgi:ankyrin repeat protein
MDSRIIIKLNNFSNLKNIIIDVKKGILNTSSKKTIHVLYNNKLKFDIKNKDGENALMNAVWDKNTELSHLLIDIGCHTDSYNENLSSLLELSVYNTELARKLLKYININVRGSHKYTVLMSAVDEPNLEVVKLFLDNGADPNATDKFGQTALIRVCSKYYDLNSKELDSNIRYPIVQLLLERGANPNIKNEDGETALKNLSSRDEKTKELLIKYGAV